MRDVSTENEASEQAEAHHLHRQNKAVLPDHQQAQTYGQQSNHRLEGIVCPGKTPG